MTKGTRKKKTKRVALKRETRCTGHCCADFTLPYSPEELKSRYLAWRRHGVAELQMSTTTETRGVSIPEDIHLIYPMLIPLGQFHNSKDAYVNPPDPGIERSYSDHHPPHHYTCKHFDPKSGNCGIYDIRPAMCRNYPYGSSCNYSGCTWKERKMKKEPKRKPGVGIEKAKSKLEQLQYALKYEPIATPKRSRLAVIQ
jgi:Fe-S-cluster containining protein